MQYKPADIPLLSISPKLNPSLHPDANSHEPGRESRVTRLHNGGLWLELTSWVRLTWLRQASLQIEITGRGECLVYADSPDQLGMDHLHAAIVTAAPQRSGGAMEGLIAAQRGDGPDWIVDLPPEGSKNIFVSPPSPFLFVVQFTFWAVYS